MLTIGRRFNFISDLMGPEIMEDVRHLRKCSSFSVDCEISRLAVGGWARQPLIGVGDRIFLWSLCTSSSGIVLESASPLWVSGLVVSNPSP